MRNSSPFNFRFIACGAVFLAVMGGQTDQLINVDFTAHLGPNFERKVGPAAIGRTPNDFWNIYSRDVTTAFDWRANGNEFDLQWSDGTGSQVDIEVRNARGLWGTGATDPMFNAYVYPLGGGAIDVSLHQLPGGPIDLYIYAHGAANSQNVRIDVEPEGQAVITKSTGIGPGWSDDIFTENDDYVVFRDIEVEENSSIFITVSRGQSGIAALNGLQIVSKSNVSETLAIQPEQDTFFTSLDIEILAPPVPTGKIRYTLDGMDPTIEAPIYSDRITITDTTTVKARLFVNNFPASAILSSSYIKVPEVVIIPAEVTFIGRTKIEITNQLGTGDIKYTLDGAEPTADSATYAGPITIESTLTISARLFLNTFPITDIYTADYVRIYAFEDDGIPFSWREEFFGANFLTLSDAAVDADPDGDGTSNLEEYLYRTDPNDSSSVPSPKLSVRAIPLLEFTTVPGKSYRLLQRSGVNDPWVTIKTITATQNQWEEHADLDAPPNSFYRVEVIE